MSVKPELAFDVCWEVYRGAREVLESKRGISALNWKDTGKLLWKPDYRPRLNEWVADFALAGRAALEPASWASRMILFRTYYLGLAPYAGCFRQGNISVVGIERPHAKNG
jgi:hypothetical protein